jgi:hypothetical protein
VNDAVAGHAGVVAREHHVSDSPRGARAAREQRNEAIAGDPAAWDVADDRVDTGSPVG